MANSIEGSQTLNSPGAAVGGRDRPSAFALGLVMAALSLAFTAVGAHAQRHGARSSPATAPASSAQPAPAPQAPLEPVSSGIGPIQFMQVNFGVPAPQALTRQLRFDDDRTRAAALSAIGAPGQYLQHGHIPMPKSIQLDLVNLSNNDDLDALLTVELDQHILTAVMIPQDGNWRRIATLLYPTPFYDPATTPSTWLRTARSLVSQDRYRAVFRASNGSLRGNFTENEAHLRIFNGKAVIVFSFESTARECSAAPAPTAKSAGSHAAASAAAAKGGCNIVHRWFQPDPGDPTHRFTLISGTGHITPAEAAAPFANSRTVIDSHLRAFSCQDFAYNEGGQRFEVISPNAPCPTK